MAATLTIGGVSYAIIEDQHDLTNALDERQRFKCDVIDYSGLAHFIKGEQVVVSDPLLGIIYSGYINSDKEVIQYPTGAILHSIDCIDQRYLADKRTYTRTYSTPSLAGKLVVDQLNDVLLAEGLTQNFALKFDSAAADFNRGLLNGTVGLTNAIGGDLELTPAGSNVTIVEGPTSPFSSGTLTNMQVVGTTLLPTTTNALCMQSTLSFAYGIEFAQSQQTVTGGSASGTANGTGTGTASGTASGSTSMTINTSASVTPSGSIFISGGNPGESASFTGSAVTINPSGFNTIPISASFSTPISTSFSTPFTATVTGNVTPPHQPKRKGKVKVKETHHDVVSVDVEVADNRVDSMIWTGSYTIASNDTLNYDVFISSTSPSQEGGVDLYFSDGTALTQYLGTLDTNTDTGLWDQNFLSVSPIQDLSDAAKDAWYTRQISLAPIAGKVITGVSLFTASNIAGVFTLYVKNCYLGSQAGSPFFGTSQTAPALNPPVVASIGAYVTAATLVTVVPAYTPATSVRVSPPYSIDAVKLVKNSLISWTTSNPVTGPAVIPQSPGSATVASTTTIFVSYDGTTWLPCTNNQPLPGLPAGANVAGLSLSLMEAFSGGQDPTAIPSIMNVTVTINSAPAATTTDITSIYGSTAAWNTGTEEGATPNANGDLALGPTSYTWNNLTNMTYVPGNLSASNPTQSVSSGAYVITSPNSPNSSWSATRFNFIAAVQNFTVQADFSLSGGSHPTQNEMGFVYRQTYWGSPNNSFAYYARIMQDPGNTAGGTSISLVYGINNQPSTVGGSPSTANLTVIKQVAVTVTNNTYYHVKVVVNQNRHTIYWNNGTTPVIDVLDNTYTAPGNVGVRTYTVDVDAVSVNSMKNFNITNTFVGLWTSLPINLSSLGTCGNTQISWSEVTANGNLQSSAIVMASLNGGTTWQQCTNGAIVPSASIPGLSPGTNVSGKSLLIQMILSCTGFLASPIIKGLYLRICGAYPGSSGTRSTAPMGNDTMIRPNQSGFGTAFDGQTWVKVGTGTDAIASNEATISNTTGDVHEVLGSRTWTDQDGTVRFQLSASTITAGIELRYTDVNNFYRLQVSTTTISVLKKSAGVTTTLGSVSMTVTPGTFYRMRFRVTGASQPVLQGNVWLDGTLEPTIDPVTGRWNNANWTITTVD